MALCSPKPLEKTVHVKRRPKPSLCCCCFLSGAILSNLTYLYPVHMGLTSASASYFQVMRTPDPIGAQDGSGRFREQKGRKEEYDSMVTQWKCASVIGTVPCSVLSCENIARIT